MQVSVPPAALLVIVTETNLVSLAIVSVRMIAGSPPPPQKTIMEVIPNLYQPAFKSSHNTSSSRSVTADAPAGAHIKS